MCTPCSLYVELRLVCPRCQKRAHRKTTIKRQGARALVVGAFVAAAALMITRIAAQRDDPYNWGKHAFSIRAFQSRVDAHPCEGASLLALARELRDAGDLVGASTQLDMAVSICKLSPQVHALSLELHLELHRLEAAARDLLRLIALEPDVAKHHYDLARVEDASGEPQRAMASFAATLRLDRDYPNALEHLIVINERIGERGVARRLRELGAVMKCARQPGGCPPVRRCMLF